MQLDVNDSRPDRILDSAFGMELKTTKSTDFLISSAYNSPNAINSHFCKVIWPLKSYDLTLLKLFFEATHKINTTRIIP